MANPADKLKNLINDMKNAGEENEETTEEVVETAPDTEVAADEATPETTETPAEEVEATDETEGEEEAAPVEEDRSLFNCSKCAGEGLEHYGPEGQMERICPDCRGTGKV